MKKGLAKRLVVYGFFLAALLAAGCQTLPTEERLGDWADITFRVEGMGRIEKGWSIQERMQAIQRAKVDIYTQLESKIMKLETDSRKKIGELAQKDPDIQHKISAFVRGAKVVQTRNDPEGVRVVAELYLGDDFKATIGLARKRTQQVAGPSRGNSPAR